MMILQPILLTTLLYLITVHPFRWNWKWKVAGTFLIAAAAFKFQILHLFGGSYFFAPDLPKWLLISAAWVYTVELIWFGLLVLFFLVRLLLRRRVKALASLKVVWISHLILLAISLPVAAAGIYAGIKLPEIREITLAFPNLPEKAEGMKIVMLTDMHIDSCVPKEWLQSVVRQCNEQNPDIIVLTGDFADGTVSKLGLVLRSMADLRAKFGVFGVSGNHEYYFEFREMMSFLSAGCGIRMLQNEAVKLPNDVWLAGIPDERGDRDGFPAPDPWKAHRNIPKQSFAILLAHQPKHAVQHGENFQLQLSGHTHGGMMPGLKQLVKLLNYGFVSGLYELPGRFVYVSNGTGIWRGFPVRIFCPSEITVFRLVQQKK